MLVARAACGTAPPSPPGRAAEPISIATLPVAPVQVAAPSSDVVVIKASGAASRGPASPRVLRRIVASRRGAVELAHGYTSVGLMVTEIVSGSLWDPDYAKRPIGTNHLEVVLVDEAAYLAPESMEGFGGTWKLTRLADGALVASAIDDTPWPASTVAGRRALIAQARKDLRSPLPEQRLAGLDALEHHAFLELVPDVIALLEDPRSHGGQVPPPGFGGPRVVGDVAEATLRKLVAPLADRATPASRSPDAWATFWGDRTTKIEMPLPVTPTTATVHVELPTYQSWPDFAITPTTAVVGVSRLETKLDGNEDGVFAIDANKRTWLSRIVPEALDAVDGPAGTGVLFAESRAGWLFKVVRDGKARDGSIVGDNARAVYNTLARSDAGFLVVGIDATKNLLALPLDALGKPRGSTRVLAIPAAPEASYHRGIQPISVARRQGGWLAAVATKNGVLAVNIDDSLRLVGTAQVSKANGIVQPKIAVGRDRAFVVWTSDHQTRRLEHVVLDLDGKPVSALGQSGSEATLVSTPVALDDGGFAAAWIEAYNEVHVGRWNRVGDRVADVVVQHHAGPFALQLARDKSALVVTYLDQARYPFPLVSRRLEIEALR